MGREKPMVKVVVKCMDKAAVKEGRSPKRLATEGKGYLLLVNEDVGTEGSTFGLLEAGAVLKCVYLALGEEAFNEGIEFLRETMKPEEPKPEEPKPEEPKPEEPEAVDPDETMIDDFLAAQPPTE